MKNYCGKDECLMTCDECMKKTLGNELDNKTPKPKTTKEKVGLPQKVPLHKDEKTGEVSKTGIISIFTGTPRRDRRAKYRNRVRENSPETFHPANKEMRAEKYYALRQIRMLKSKRK